MTVLKERKKAGSSIIERAFKATMMILKIWKICSNLSGVGGDKFKLFARHPSSSPSFRYFDENMTPILQEDGWGRAL